MNHWQKRIVRTELDIFDPTIRMEDSRICCQQMCYLQSATTYICQYELCQMCSIYRCNYNKCEYRYGNLHIRSY